MHIVRSGETLVKIADAYHCEISDITSNNLHITDFKNLLPGSKLKIPFLSKETVEILEETESFISDYYPSFNGVKNDKNKVVEKKEVISENFEKIGEEIIVEKPCDECKVNKTNNSTPMPKFNSNYSGNVIPTIPPNFIRKI